MSSLRRLLLENLGLKGLSLLLAVLLWLQISGQQTVQRLVSVPVEFVNMPPGLEIASEYDRRVDVVISFERAGASFDERQLAAVIDLKDLGPGSQIIPLTERNIERKPYGVAVVSVAPSRIRLQLERTDRKIIRVRPEVVGAPASGCEVTDVQVIPTEVMVSGPESRVQKVTEVHTEAVHIDGRNSSIRQAAYLNLADPRLRIEGASSVTVLVQIEEKRRRVRLIGVPVQLLPEEARAELLTRTVEVTGTVPVSFTTRLKAATFRAVVNVGEFQPATTLFELVPQIVPPEETADVFRTSSVTPPRVRLRRAR